jgi:hypothetical protein
LPEQRRLIFKRDRHWRSARKFRLKVFPSLRGFFHMRIDVEICHGAFPRFSFSHIAGNKPSQDAEVS